MKKGNQEVADKITFKNLRRLYFFALWTIAITIILSQLLIQYNLKQQLSDSKIINISGKQRMLSQRITKEVLILNFVSDASPKKEIAHVRNVLSLWQINQDALENGSDSLSFPKEKSEALSKLYEKIKPSFNNIVESVNLFLLNLEQKNNSSDNQKLVQKILKNEGIFLSKMNEIVSQYDKGTAYNRILDFRIYTACFAFRIFVHL
jgi:two-component system sensor histidine kinase DegS